MNFKNVRILFNINYRNGLNSFTRTIYNHYHAYVYRTGDANTLSDSKLLRQQLSRLPIAFNNRRVTAAALHLGYPLRVRFVFSARVHVQYCVLPPCTANPMGSFNFLFENARSVYIFYSDRSRFCYYYWAGYRHFTNAVFPNCIYQQYWLTRM